MWLCEAVPNHKLIISLYVSDERPTARFPAVTEQRVDFPCLITLDWLFLPKEIRGYRTKVDMPGHNTSITASRVGVASLTLEIGDEIG